MIIIAWDCESTWLLRRHLRLFNNGQSGTSLIIGLCATGCGVHQERLLQQVHPNRLRHRPDGAHTRSHLSRNLSRSIRSRRIHPPRHTSGRRPHAERPPALTAPARPRLQGHTLRLLSLPDFLDLTLGKVVRLRQKLSSAATAVKSIFGQQDADQDEAVNKLEALKRRLQEVKDLFRNQKTTEFVIVTIPTVLAISESGRLLQSLRAESVPVSRLVVNQLLRRPAAGSADVAELRETLAAREGELLKLLEGAGGISDEQRHGAVASLGELKEAREALLKALQADVSFCSLKRKVRSAAAAASLNFLRCVPSGPQLAHPHVFSCVCRRSCFRAPGVRPRRTKRRRWS